MVVLQFLLVSLSNILLIFAVVSARRLYRGIVPPLMLEVPKRAIKCRWLALKHKSLQRLSCFSTIQLLQMVNLASFPFSICISHGPRLTIILSGWWGGIFTSKGQRKNTQSLAILTGCFAGASESIVVTPFELVKIRLQDKSSTFKGPLDVVRHSFKTSGPLGCAFYTAHSVEINYGW